MKFARLLVACAAGVSAGFSVGCDDDHPHAAPAGNAAPAANVAADAAGAHAHGPNGEHASPAMAASAPVAGHGGPVIALGTATAGGFTLVATRDQGVIEAGKDAPVDVVVTSTAGAKAAAVRFWIGTEDAKGSVKAKADVENPAEPNRWHTHTEIPDPLPTDAKLWIEVEAEGGAKSIAGIDLKRS